MRIAIAFVASMAVACVVVLLLVGRNSAQQVVTGTIGEYVAGEFLSVANETTDPMGVQIALRKTTAFDGDPALITPGLRVTVWYRSVTERRPVADRVRVVPEP